MVQYDQTVDGVPRMFSSDPKAAWSICRAKTCLALADNKLYKCAVLASMIEGVAENALQKENWSSALTYSPLTLESAPQEIVEHLNRRHIPECTICPGEYQCVSPRQLFKGV